MAFRVFSSAFAEGAMIPALHTCQGADVSPTLEWAGEPAGTRSFTLIVDDPDAPAGVWVHWLLYDIPAKVHTLSQGVQSTALTGTNSFGKAKYGGPCPPHGNPHRYYFRLYALDRASLGLPAGANRAELEHAMAAHILAEAQYMGRFKR